MKTSSCLDLLHPPLLCQFFVTFGVSSLSLLIHISLPTILFSSVGVLGIPELILFIFVLYSRMTEQFAIVVFADGDDESVAVVPVGWLNDGDAYWAPYTNQAIFDKSVMSCEKPSKNWKKYPCRILGIKGY